MSPTTRIVLASNNPGKTDEINRMLADTEIRVVSQSEFNIGEAIEDGITFVENALIKARYATSKTGLPAIADDSGLEVDAINGRPGVRSSRYSNPGANDAKNISKLLVELQNVEFENRTCRFRCVMVYLRHTEDASPVIAEGTLHGYVHHHRQGAYGFGYDPVVWLPEKRCTLAELNVIAKNEISHRGMALRRLVEQLVQL